MCKYVHKIAMFLSMLVLLLIDKPALAYTQSVISGVVSKTDFPLSKDFDENLRKEFDISISRYDSNNSKKPNKYRLTPEMAFATVCGEAGSLNENTMLFVLAGRKKHYDNKSINWQKLSEDIQTVDSLWYYTFAENEINIAQDGEAYGMPTTLLQGWTKTGTFKNNLGVGSYQISTKDWSNYNLDRRVAPVQGYLNSIKRYYKYWEPKGITVNSDLTLYACQSLSHQGVGFFASEMGRNIIGEINKPKTQDLIWKYGMKMYEEFKITKRHPSTKRLSRDLCKELGVDFYRWNHTSYSTNQGGYTLRHAMQYAMYRIYFNEGKMPDFKKVN